MLLVLLTLAPLGIAILIVVMSLMRKLGPRREAEKKVRPKDHAILKEQLKIIQIKTGR